MSAHDVSLTFYHNPKCNKSRTALALLEERGLKDVTKLL
jgi:arsenate reductase-like glutaredoxin family protein